MIIGITGKPGIGKSTLMVNLACSFAKQGFKTAVMSADMSYQSIQYYFGNTKIECEQSLGLLFQRKDILRPEKYFVRAQGYGNIYVAGISSGEGSLKYDLPDKDDINKFLDELYNNFDYVFIESAENIKNRLSFLSLVKANVILDVIDISVQGISYKLSVKDVLESINTGRRIIRIAAANKRLENIKNAEKVLDLKIDFQIPYCTLSDNCANAGIPIIYAAAGDGKIKFIKFIDKLAKILVEGGSLNE